MGRRFLRPLRRDCSRRSLLYRDTERSGAEMKILGMDQRDDYQEAKNNSCENVYEEHGKGNTRLRSKDQAPQRRRQQFTGTEEVSERVDPKTGWRWYDHPSTSSSSSSSQAASWWKSSSWNERFFLKGLKVFSLTCNGDSFVSNGECTQDTKPARNVTFPHTCFFSRSVLC